LNKHVYAIVKAIKKINRLFIQFILVFHCTSYPLLQTAFHGQISLNITDRHSSISMRRNERETHIELNIVGCHFNLSGFINKEWNF